MSRLETGKNEVDCGIIVILLSDTQHTPSIKYSSSNEFFVLSSQDLTGAVLSVLSPHSYCSLHV